MAEEIISEANLSYSSKLDLFSPPTQDVSLSESVFIKYNPMAPIADGRQIDFQISGAGKHYWQST
jgi:hypothetical protein